MEGMDSGELLKALNTRVVSFTMRTEVNGDSIFLDSNQDILTPQQLAVIRQLNTGLNLFLKE